MDHQFQCFKNNDFVIPRDQCTAFASVPRFLQETLPLSGNTVFHELPVTLRRECQRPTLQSLRLRVAEPTVRTSALTLVLHREVICPGASSWQRWAKNPQVLPLIQSAIRSGGKTHHQILGI